MLRALSAFLVATACALAIGLPLASHAAAPPADCAPAGHLANYPAAEAPMTRAYDAVEFTVTDNGSDQPVVVAGKLCRQHYELKEGAEIASDLELQTNYRDQLTKAGAEILFASGRYTTARLGKGTAAETWVQVYSSESSVEVVVLRVQPHQLVLAKPSGNDLKFLGHMPDFVAEKPEKRNFDNLAFDVQDADGEHQIEVQGAKTVLNYTLKEGVTPPSDLDIQMNYRATLKAVGGQIVYAGTRLTTAHLDLNGVSTWIAVFSSESSVLVSMIEEKALTLSIAPPSEDALKKSLDSDGRVALYVPFDFDKATLQPEAAPVIALMVKLLKDNPPLKVTIEGHTDNIGSQDYNQKLSDARANAVAAAVMAGGIARDRLNATGIGAGKPIADNATAEGRARNRRVELVKS